MSLKLKAKDLEVCRLQYPVAVLVAKHIVDGTHLGKKVLFKTRSKEKRGWGLLTIVYPTLLHLLIPQ